MKAALHEVMYAETSGHARDAITRFAREYSAKYAKPVTTLEQDADVLLTFFDFPAEHCAPRGEREQRGTCCSPRGADVALPSRQCARWLDRHGRTRYPFLALR